MAEIKKIRIGEVEYTLTATEVADGFVLPIEKGGTGVSAEKVEDARNALGAAPMNNATIIEEPIYTTHNFVLHDNSIYDLTVESGSESFILTFDVNDVTGNYGAAVCLHLKTGVFEIQFSGATVTNIDTVAMAAGQYWEISVFKKAVIMKYIGEETVTEEVEG